MYLLFVQSGGVFSGVLFPLDMLAGLGVLAGKQRRGSTTSGFPSGRGELIELSFMMVCVSTIFCGDKITSSTQAPNCFAA